MQMQRYSSAAIVNFQRNFLSRLTATSKMANRVVTNKDCDVFINHRGIDTKRTIATLLYDHLSRLNLKPFLDNKNMKPGDKLFDNIDNAIRNCKVGVTVFSPNYCKSYFCLHELALIMESKKKVIPIFCDIKPSQLRVVNDGNVPAKDLQRFKLAVEEAQSTVGLTFDSLKGNLSDVVTSASDFVIESLIEMENEKQMVKSSRASPITL
ncbi:Toll-Interleukin-Resistance domain family protein [Theobroma cacao]|uniref:Toll-Interleukin-Resistance domain family protein n=1 Tax=Theobroma cacao TaxID=3641 RepID=A0A061FEE2_THECC|nr:Toll-Interleukin-Resistance domain family protein [Theobroma cacao]